MPISSNYIGHRIYLYKENGDDLANATICDYRRSTMTVSVKRIPYAETIHGFVVALILTDDGVYEYKGKLRQSTTNSMYTDILLFGGKEKEKRAAKRYAVNTTGAIINLIFDQCPAALLNPLNVSIANLSTTGALIRTRPNSFTLNCLIEMDLNIYGSITTLQGEIVWIKEVDQYTCDYGCKFIQHT